MLFLTSILLMAIINRFGRKTILKLSCLFQALAQLIATTALLFNMKYLFLVAILTNLVMFSLNFGGVIYIYQVEILPPELVAVVSFFQFGSCILFSYFTLPVLEKFGSVTVFIFLTTVTFVCWVIIEGYCIETKGKTINQIQSEFKNKRFFKN